MTIEELFNANKDMDIHDICVVHCNYDHAECRPIDDIWNRCVIYQGDYYTMPNVLKVLKVLSFRHLKDSGLNEEPNKWKIWVV